MVDKYIKEILFEHGKVYVRGIGLIFKNFSEDVNLDPFILNQPRYSLHIDENYKNEEDSWLVYATARGEHVTTEEAEELINKRVSEIKTDLEEGKEVTIERVGTIVKEYGKVVFSHHLASISEEESDKYFGIPEKILVHTDVEENVAVEEAPTIIPINKVAPPVAYPVVEKPEIASNPTEPESEPTIGDSEVYEDEERGSRKGLIAAAVIILLICAGIIYYFVSQNKASSKDPIATTNEEIQTTTENNTITETANNEPVTEVESSFSTEKGENSSKEPSVTHTPLTIKEKGKRYHIIVGSFTINENAQKLKRRLSAKGIKAKVLDPKDQSPLFRVSLADFEELDPALSRTEKLKKTLGNSLWILKY